MTKSNAALDNLPLRNAKATIRSSEAVLRKSSDLQGSLVARALERAGINRKEAAAYMDISDSLLTRQLNDVEHLSWQRLSRLPDAFFLELLIVLAESRGIARVRTQIEMERKVG